MSGADELADLASPSHPPPLLSTSEVERLCYQGHLALTLPEVWTRHFGALFAEADKFFSWPEDAKKAAFPSPAADTEHGYVRIPGEKEYLTLRHAATPRDSTWRPDASPAHDPAVIENAIRDVWRDAAHLLHRILADISGHLGLAATAWDGLMLDSLQLPHQADQATPTLLRVFRYEPKAGLADPHRDLGLLTLCICRGRGLEVWERAPGRSERQPSSVLAPTAAADAADDARLALSQEGSVPGWRDAGEITVMTGDTLRVFSTNRIPAARHRVVATDQGRNSIVFAMRATTRHPIHLEPLGGQGVIDSVALWNTLKSQRFNVNAQKDVREQQRRLKDEQRQNSIA